MPSPQDKDLWASIRLGPLQVDLAADGHGYSPDLVNDLLGQLSKSFVEALRSSIELGAFPKFEIVVDVDDDEDSEEDSEQ